MPSVLILDDDPCIRQSLTHTLEANSFKVQCARTAEEANEHLGKQHFDLILLDFAMPEHDGKWFMQNIRIKNKTKVLLITGFVSRELINTMFSLGVSGYLIKPIDEEMLIHNIHYYLGSPITDELGNSIPAP
ncbi:MAG: response regulator [Kiritimatiellia bacterium]